MEPDTRHDWAASGIPQPPSLIIPIKLAVGRLLGVRNIFVVQIFLFRYLLYIAAAYISMRTGSVAVIMYAAGIIGLSLSILIVYGIGGVKKQ